MKLRIDVGKAIIELGRCKVVNLEEAIEESKKIMVSWNRREFRKYDACYGITNEYLRLILDEVFFKKDRALTVLASGDQAFNLICKGVRNIDTFDINVLTYFYFQLRVAMVKNLGFKEFAKVSSNIRKLEVLKKLVKKLRKSLGEEVYEYYCKIIEFAISDKTRINRLFINSFDHQICGFYNYYLDCEDSYLNLRRGLQETEFTFTFNDARVLPLELKQKYDIILLSNIVDYVAKDEEMFCKFINSYYEHLEQNGVVIGYSLGCFNTEMLLRPNHLSSYDKDIEVKTLSIYDKYYLKRKKR